MEKRKEKKLSRNKYVNNIENDEKLQLLYRFKTYKLYNRTILTNNLLFKT